MLPVMPILTAARPRVFSVLSSPGSIHAPSELRTEESVQELVKQLEGGTRLLCSYRSSTPLLTVNHTRLPTVPQVIFHCALSRTPRLTLDRRGLPRPSYRSC